MISYFYYKKNNKFSSTLFDFFILFFIVFLCLFSKNNIESAKKGAINFFEYVFPSLFTFLIAINLLSYSNLPYYISRIFHKLMPTFFGISGIGIYPFIFGLLSGFPTGAKIICDLKKSQKISNIEAERLISFCNNSGPLFILGTVGFSLLKDTTTGILLLIVQILASISVGLLFKKWKNYIPSTTFHFKKNNIDLRSIGKYFSESIQSAITSILSIGGIIIFFSVVTSIIKDSHILSGLFNYLPKNINLFFQNFLLGLLELTNGIFDFANLNSKYLSFNIIVCSFLLGFGGISVMLQTISIIREANISIRPYILGKIFQGCFASLYTYIIYTVFPFTKLDFIYLPLGIILIILTIFFINFKLFHKWQKINWYIVFLSVYY